MFALIWEVEQLLPWQAPHQLPDVFLQNIFFHNNKNIVFISSFTDG